MGQTLDFLSEQAALTVAASQALRAHRASLGRVRFETMAERQELREQTSVLSHRCQQRRESLQAAIDRWAYVARFFPAVVSRSRAISG